MVFCSFDRLQRDSCFHFRVEASPLPRFHLRSLFEAAILHLNEWSEFWGALQQTELSLVLCQSVDVEF